MKRWIRWPELLLAGFGIALLAGWGAQTWSSHRFQAEAGRRLDRASVGDRDPFEQAFERDVPGALAIMSPLAARAAPPARIEIARIRLDAMIDEGTSARVLDRAVGHLSSTPGPGEDGNCVLAGHRDTFFGPLKGVRVGDVVRLSTAEGRWDYRVTGRDVVSPRRIDLLRATERPTLTLVTCYPFRWIGPAPMRLVVRAERVDA